MQQRCAVTPIVCKRTLMRVVINAAGTVHVHNCRGHATFKQKHLSSRANYHHVALMTGK
jgi:hypothetical protein